LSTLNLGTIVLLEAKVPLKKFQCLEEGRLLIQPILSQ
jgi:hypothetical protein